MKDTLENDPVGKRDLGIMMAKLRYCDIDNSKSDSASLVAVEWPVGVLVTLPKGICILNLSALNLEKGKIIAHLTNQITVDGVKLLLHHPSLLLL